MTQIKVLDISWRQDNVDFVKAKADGVQAVMIKATEGNNYSQLSYFKTQVPRAVAAGLNVGAYHFARFTSIDDAKSEAAYFLSSIKGFPIDYPVALDIEVNGASLDRKTLTDCVVAFLEEIEHAGYFAMWYSYEYFVQTQLDATRLTPYASWVAKYASTSPVIHTDMWQFTDRLVVNGVPVPVDTSWSYRDFAWEIPLRKIGAIGTVIATANNLNVRDKPDISGNIVGQIHPKDGEYVSHRLVAGWHDVGAGWVSGNYVTFRSL